MVFKYKDLMVNVVPQEQLKFCILQTCALNQAISKITACGPCSMLAVSHCHVCASQMISQCHVCASLAISPCACMTPAFTPFYASPNCGTPDPGPEWDIGQLKEHLQIAIRELEQQEQLTTQPQTVAEAEQLEVKMQDALKELGRIKENLRKSAPPKK
jgi:hypothetical protein